MICWPAWLLVDVVALTLFGTNALSLKAVFWLLAWARNDRNWYAAFGSLDHLVIDHATPPSDSISGALRREPGSTGGRNVPRLSPIDAYSEKFALLADSDRTMAALPAWKLLIACGKSVSPGAVGVM